MFAEDPCGMDFQNNWSKAHYDKCFLVQRFQFYGDQNLPFHSPLPVSL